MNEGMTQTKYITHGSSVTYLHRVRSLTWKF